MAKASLLTLSLSFFILLFNGSLARQQSQQSQQQEQSQCQIRSISALEPIQRVQAEAGYTERWDSRNQQFQCAGVQLIRHNIRQRGLLLPSYVNAPLLVYVEQGRGTLGVTVSGCPETFESSRQQSEQSEREGEGQRFRDQHQQVHYCQQGDIVAIPTGAAHWLYNDGDDELVAVVMIDTSNEANQLDQYKRRFFLAGNPQLQGQQQTRYQAGKQGQQQEESGNIFNGFDLQILAEAFNVDTETARKLQGQDDQRGHIVNVERGLQVVRPPRSREEQEREEQEVGPRNGLDELVCTTKLRHNIDDPSRADFYNPQAGRSTTLNSNKLPILRLLQLSAEREVLHRNAMVAPHWTLNAHSLVYVTKGSVRMQIVNNQGQAVFNDEVREGQALVVPQNFAVAKQAGEQGCRCIKFRTNDNAVINTLAGRTSAMKAMPLDVIANAYQISREQARRLKYNREETLLFSPSSRSGVMTMLKEAIIKVVN